MKSHFNVLALVAALTVATTSIGLAQSRSGTVSGQDRTPSSAKARPTPTPSPTPAKEAPSSPGYIKGLPSNTSQDRQLKEMGIGPNGGDKPAPSSPKKPNRK